MLKSLKKGFDFRLLTLELLVPENTTISYLKTIKNILMTFLAGSQVSDRCPFGNLSFFILLYVYFTCRTFIGFQYYASVSVCFFNFRRNIPIKERRALSPFVGPLGSQKSKVTVQHHLWIDLLDE